MRWVRVESGLQRRGVRVWFGRGRRSLSLGIGGPNLLSLCGSASRASAVPSSSATSPGRSESQREREMTYGPGRGMP